MAAFPAELTDRVIDFLHSDKHALFACSLVCKSWVPASRYHLFRELLITLTKAQSLLELFGSTTTKDDTGASGEPSHSISNRPRQLPRGLETFNYVQSVFWRWQTHPTNEVALEDSVMQIIASFPQLSEFRISNWGDSTHPSLGYLRNIKKFSDFCWMSNPVAETALVVANNPGLEHLVISIAQLGHLPLQQLHDVFANIPPNSPPLKLQHLSLRGFLFHPRVMSHLRSLTSLEWAEPEGNANVLSAELWQTLKSEKIQLSRLKTSLSHDSLLEFLSSFQGMKDLRLNRIIGEDDDDSDRLARTLFQVVRTHHADTLETLHIGAHYKRDWCFVHHDITPILNYTNLRELGTSLYWPNDRINAPPDHDVTPVFRLLNNTSKLPRLRLLQITTINYLVGVTYDAISRFDPRIGGGATRNPVSKVLAGDRWFEWREGQYRRTTDF